MDLSRETIERYKKIFQEDYGFELSDEEIREIDTSMVSLFQVVYKPIPEEHYKQFLKRE